MKIVDYNVQRDFVGWGAEEFRPIAGMPGFTHYAALSAMGLGASGVAAADFNGDGKMDVCLLGASRASLLVNDGGILNEASPVADAGARAAAWGDSDGDGRRELLLATPEGPKLLAWNGKALEDVSEVLPRMPYYNLTAAAWLDYDGDGRQDILLADGLRGLRLWRNLDPKAVPDKPTGLGPWQVAGPFDNTNGAGFAAVYEPEKGVDLKAVYAGKGGEKVAWKAADFKDGQVNTLMLFGPAGNENAAAYVYREIEVAAPAELPASFGSDDTLTVWLNGKQLLAENAARGCAPDQAKLTLKLRAGKNTLLMKICTGGGDFAFYFAAAAPVAKKARRFEDVSEKVGLGVGGVAGDLKGDHLAIADVNGDGRPDVLYSAGSGVLALNTPGGFVAAKDSGISYQSGGIAPVFGDFNGDGRPDLFVPQIGLSRLFANAGNGKFTDVTASAGAMAQPIGRATCAAWTRLAATRSGALAVRDARGALAPAGAPERPDLLVGCVKGPNRYFRNNGDGTFTDAGADIGLDRRIFNTRGLAVVDINGDGAPDVIFNNEGLESAVLLGRREALPTAGGEGKP